MTVAASTPIQALSLFLADVRYETIPEDVREIVSNVILDFFGSAVAGQLLTDTRRIEGLALALGGGKKSSVIAGSPNSLAGAVLINGFQAAAATASDSHPDRLRQVASAVIPPALAIAGERSLGGRDLLVAVAGGLETSMRIGIGLGYDKMRKLHWHWPGIVGPFGGAAAVGLLAKFDVRRFHNAISLAGTQSAGTFAQRGTSGMAFQQMNGGLSGLLAALLAEQGFQAKPEILTAARGGLFNLYSDGGNPDAVGHEIGAIWELAKPSGNSGELIGRKQAASRFRESASQALDSELSAAAVEMLLDLPSLRSVSDLLAVLSRSAAAA